MRALKVILVLASVIGAALAGYSVWAGRASPKASVPPVASLTSSPARFVGRQACVGCHQAADAAWRGSHHELAMQDATSATVLGNFDNASFTYHDVTTTFSRQGDEFHVRTDGPDGAPHDYKVAYTFGVAPLQQYLIEFPGGRYQALNVCWDTRPKEAGGQRWFHLYPDANVTSEDILHWTGPYQNWNHMCAECHSTAVRKNYDAATESFKTSWSEIDVSCEACHGPGSNHVSWGHRNAASRNKSDPAGPTLGLVARLREDTPAIWAPDPATGIAKRQAPRTSRTEIETCARCHSRRGTFNEDVLPGRPPADTHRLALLEPNLYEADGQILDEDYEYGSFIQSRMYAAGVTCTECHDPHSLKTASGNAVCARCHDAARFDTSAHHFHAAGTKGSACVECHMPTRTYMVVHARHDHSLRVPRPDLTVSIGTPNACNGCHADRTAQWAADEIARRTPGKSKRPHFGETLAAGRRGQPGAEAMLGKLVADVSQPAIARATAAEMLGGAQDQRALLAALGDGDPLVRAAVARSVNAPDPVELAKWLSPLLSDPVRLVRIDAARRMASVPESTLGADQAAALRRAMDEYVAAQNLDADRAEARLNLGSLFAERGDAAAAERQYLAALRLSPRFPAGYVNLGDLYRQLGREEDAMRVLREGFTKATGSADLPFALGLALVRNKQLTEAIPLLERAATLAPDVTRFSYVYGVALESAGPPGRGIDVLKRAHERRPNDVEVLSALALYSRAAGKLDDAVEYAGLLAALRPSDPAVRGLLDQLKAERAGNPGR